MTQKTIKTFLIEIYSKLPKRIALQTKHVYHINNIWSLGFLDLKDYGPGNIRGSKYVLVIIDNFSNYGWTLPLKSKIAQTITNCFEIFSISSKRKPGWIETDRGKEFFNNKFQNFSSNNNIKH